MTTVLTKAIISDVATYVLFCRKAITKLHKMHTAGRYTATKGAKAFLSAARFGIEKIAESGLALTVTDELIASVAAELADYYMEDIVAGVDDTPIDFCDSHGTIIKHGDTLNIGGVSFTVHQDYEGSIWLCRDDGHRDPLHEYVDGFDGHHQTIPGTVVASQDRKEVAAW